MTPTAAPAPTRPFLPAWLPWVIVAAQLCWLGGGIWPVVPLEGDEQGVLFGLAGMQQQDATLLASRYLYQVQPGSYHVLLGLSRILPASNETLFAAGTALGAVAFALVGARLLQVLLARPFAWMLMAMLWCQETFSAAYYMNTSALAAALAVGGVLLAGSPRRLAWVGAGLLLALAGWMRADSLLVSPACLAFAFWTARRWPAALARTTAVALLALAVLSLLLALNHGSLLAAAGSYGQRDYFISGWRTLAETSFSLLSPALGLAALAGFVALIWQRRLPLAGVVLGGVIPSLLSYGGSITSPKYFYYLVPFALVPAVWLIDRLVRHARELSGLRRAALWSGLGLLFAADGLLGLRSLAAEQRLFTVAPTWATLAQWSHHGKHFALVVGPGELIGNADGFRVRTGQLFAPWCWRREKQHLVEQLHAVRGWLSDRRDLTVYWSSWLPYQLAARELFAAGFQPQERHGSGDGLIYHGLWRRGEQRARLDFLGYVGSRYQAPGPAPAATVGENVYFIGEWAHQPITELSDGASWQVVSRPVEGFISLHRRPRTP